MSEQEKTAALAEIEAARNQPPTLTEVAKMLAAKLEPLMAVVDYTEPNVSIASGVTVTGNRLCRAPEVWHCHINFLVGDYDNREPVGFLGSEATLPELITAMEQQIAGFIEETTKKTATHE